MKLAIIGATGNAGGHIVNEAIARGHEVTAIARNPAKIQAGPHLSVATGDTSDPASLANLLQGHDAVISAVPFRQSKPEQLIEAIRRAGVKRYLAVGGAGSLEVAPGKLLVESPDFPAIYREESLGGKAFLDVIRGVKDLDWTVLSPSALLVAGKRTGKFRLGGDALLADASGKSWISLEDFAVALLDDIETPRHIRQRFTVGY